MRKMLSILLLLIVTSFSFGADFVVPDQKILGADKPVPLGEAIELSLPAVNPKPENYLSTSYTWKVFSLPDGVEKKEKVRSFEDKDGTQGIFFGGGVKGKKFLVNCNITHLFAIKVDGKITEVATRNVILTVLVSYGESDVPVNPDKPDKPDNPDTPIVFPDGKFKLAKFIYDETVKLPPTVRVKAAQELAKSFNELSVKAASGVFVKVQDLLVKTKELNDKALSDTGVDVALFKDWAAHLNDKLYGLYKDGSLRTIPDFGAAYKEIVDGLKLVK